jgi:hypothetical protein
MKKISLILLALVSFTGRVGAQAGFTIVAPPYNNGISSVRAPNGTPAHSVQNTVMYIHPSELNPMGMGSITNFSIQYYSGTGSVSVPGNFTVYMQNTSDAAYNKGTDWTVATSSMTTVYLGSFTVPAAVSDATVPVTLTTPFTYTGGGLYVAWSWEMNGVPASTAAAVKCNLGNTWCYTVDSPTVPASTTLTGSAYRPSLIFSAVNTATNELMTLSAEAKGKTPFYFNESQTISARIRNSSATTQNNVPVTLSISGASSFLDTQTITSIAAGAVTTVTFSAFTATSMGLNSITVSVPADDNNTNNAVVVTQSVTCDMSAIPPAALTASDFVSGAYGGGLPMIFAARVTASSNCSLNTVDCVIPSNALFANSGKSVYPVLCDATGSVIATGITASISAAMMDKFTSFAFNPSSRPALQTGTVYLIGIGMSAGGYYPVGATSIPLKYPVSDQFMLPQAGGTPTAIVSDFLALQATFSFSQLAISASGSPSLTCTGEPFTLTASSSSLASFSTYSWSAPAALNVSPQNNSSTNFIVTPTSGATSTVGTNFTFSVTASSSNGCKSAVAVVAHALSSCASLKENGASGIQIFPNPMTNGKTTISGLRTNAQIVLFNAIGQVIQRISADRSEVNVDLASHPSGCYLVQVIEPGSETVSFRLIHQ